MKAALKEILKVILCLLGSHDKESNWHPSGYYYDTCKRLFCNYRKSTITINPDTDIPHM